jgi:hypothetical protein
MTGRTTQEPPEGGGSSRPPTGRKGAKEVDLYH